MRIVIQKTETESLQRYMIHKRSHLNSANQHEDEQRYEELEKRLHGEQEAAAHEESEILKRKHATTTMAAAQEESETPDPQRTTMAAETANDDAEILEQTR